MVRPIYEPRITPYQPPMLSRSERVPQASDCNPKSLKNIAVMVARARHIRAGYMFYSEAALKARVNLSVAPSMVWASLAQNASHIVWLDMHINHMNMEESRTVSPCKPRLRGKRMEGWEEERKATILSQHSQYSVTRDIECTFHLQIQRDGKTRIKTLKGVSTDFCKPMVRIRDCVLQSIISQADPKKRWAEHKTENGT